MAEEESESESDEEEEDEEEEDQRWGVVVCCENPLSGGWNGLCVLAIVLQRVGLW